MRYTVAIIGGGPAGAAAALSIANRGLSVAVVESTPVVQARIGETLRSGARSLLQALGAWDHFVAGGHICCTGNVSAWGAYEEVERDFIFDPSGPSWQLDRKRFEESLIAKVEEGGGTVFRGVPVHSVERLRDGWRIRAGAKELNAEWLIDATGRRATVARMLGIKRSIFDRLVAVHAIARPSEKPDEDSRTYIEACEDGWWYTALLPDGSRRVSFQTDADLLPKDVWRTSAWFCDQFRRLQLLSPLLERQRYTFQSPPAVTSAHSGRLEVFSGDQWLATGDAAMSFDPLSGNGLLSAMRSGVKAAEAIHEGGRRESVFDEWHAGEWNQYWDLRDRYYAAEERWPGHEFWKRRRVREVAQPIPFPSGIAS